MRCVGEKGYLGFGVADGVLCSLRWSVLCEQLVCAVVLCVVVGGFVFAPQSAVASSSVFACRLAGPEAKFSEPGGVATDAAGDLWVAGTLAPSKLYEFSAPCVKPEPVAEMSLAELTESIEGAQHATFTSPESLAIDAAGNFYATGKKDREGVLPRVGVFEKNGEPFTSWEEKWLEEQGLKAEEQRRRAFGVPASVAVYGPVVYVSHGESDPGAPRGDGLPQGIERFNASGECVAFAGSASYVKGCEIEGVEGEGFGSGILAAPNSIVVDQEGNLYALDANYNAEQTGKVHGAVVEYNAEGVLVGACTGEENPGLGGDHKGWGTEGLLGVAVDPVSGDVFVSIANGNNEGAVDVFQVVLTGPDSSECHFQYQITEAETGVPLTSPADMTVDPGGDDLYVVESAEGVVDVYGLRQVLPGVKIEQASKDDSTEVTVNGSVDPEGQGLSECHFQYVPEIKFNENVEAHKGEGFADLEGGGEEECTPSASEITTSSGVHADLKGLMSGTTYRYRLVATTSGVLGGTSVSGSLAFTTLALPGIEATSVTNISSAFAELHAVIDPLGSDTKYHFEYDTRAYADGEGSHGVSIPVTAEEEGIGSGGETGGAPASVVQQIGGLAPGTTYYFRVVAGNSIGGVEGAWCEGGFLADCSFTTLPQSGEGLPDGRAYELLTPPDKGSSEDMFALTEIIHNEFRNHDVGFPSESGEEFLLETDGAFGSSCGGSGSSFAASAENVYVFRRDAGARCWQMLPLASPDLGVQSVAAGVFDPSDFSLVAFGDELGSIGGSGGRDNVSLLGAPGSGPLCEGSVVSSDCYEKLHSEAVSEVTGTRFVGASRDLSHIVLESTDHTVVPGVDEGQDAGTHALWEWDGGEFKLVSVNPEGAPFQCGAMLGQGYENVNGGGEQHNAVSADGQKVFFTAPDPRVVNDDHSYPGCWEGTTGGPQTNSPQLYVHSGGRTVEVSRPEAGVSDPTCPDSVEREACHLSVYVGASEDGSKVFFLTDGELTQEAVELKLEDPELYEYETETGKLIRVSAGEPGYRGAAGVSTVPAISADGSSVYFTAFAALAPGATVYDRAEPGPVNLYRYETEVGRTVYVGTVDTRDYPQLATGRWWGEKTTEIRSGGVALGTHANWYTTPDGRYLLFSSIADLTGYSTAEAKHSGPEDCPAIEAEVVSGHCDEVYRYDADAAEKGEPSIICVSCDRSGESPVSNAFFATTAGSEEPAAGPVRAMSDDGSCVFFDSADPLVKQADNHTLDVHEWEAYGALGCKPAEGGGGCELLQGCIYLIGSGDDPSPSYFLGASANGSNVFFGTHAQLVAQDTDTAGDLYDARIGGGFPVRGTVGECEDGGCSTPALEPIDATPSSLTFSGPENAIGETKAVTRTDKKTKQSRAQKLAAALNVCAKKRMDKRKQCDEKARKRYGKTKKKAAGKKAKKSARRNTMRTNEGVQK